MSAQEVLAVAVMAAVVLLVVSARPRPARGRHRRTKAEPDVFDRVLADSSVNRPSPLLALVAAPEVLPFVPALDYRDFDDWTADLPTEQLDLAADFYDDVSLAAIRFAAETRHTSPSERAKERWRIECPIFAELAEQWGYELGGDLNPMRTAA